MLATFKRTSLSVLPASHICSNQPRRKCLFSTHIYLLIDRRVFWDFCLIYLFCVHLSFKVNWVSKEWAKRAALPSHVVTMLDNFPTNLHPMSQFSAAITALNSESSFARAYSEGVHKSKYWEVSLHPYLFFEKYGLIELFFCLFFLLKRLNHFRHKNTFSLVLSGLFLLCNLSFFFFFKVYLWRFYGLDCQAPLHCCQDLP